MTGASFARAQHPRNVRANNGFEYWQRRTETPLLVLAVVFLAVLLAPYVFPLSDTASRIIFLLNVAIWIVFAVDYLARLYLALDRWAFVRGNVVDLLIVLLPMLRPFRALRLLRVLRLSAVAGMAQKRAAESLHARVTAYVVTAVLAAVVAAGAGVREAERGSPDANIRSLADGLWWAATTVTTVGYGDRYPTTSLGRLVAVALMLVGIALLGVVTASIAAWFVDRLQAVEASVEEVEQRTEATMDEVMLELRALRKAVEASRQS